MSMTFEEWWNKEGMTTEDEFQSGYFTKEDMRWIAELSWKAAIKTTEPIDECNEN